MKQQILKKKETNGSDTLRYWSTTHNEVWVTYYTSLFFGHAEAEEVSVKMYEQLLSDGIPVDKMATLI